MTETPPKGTLPLGAGDIEELARDWLTMWESELTSLAADREMREFWTRLVALWTNAARLASGVAPRPDGGAGTTAQARTAAAAAASDARDAAYDHLDERLAAIEARLAVLESKLHEGPASARGARPRGRRRSSGVPPRRTR